MLSGSPKGSNFDSNEESSTPFSVRDTTIDFCFSFQNFSGNQIRKKLLFKCGLHYFSTFKLFQRNIFACSTKEFSHVYAISYNAMVKILSILQYEFSEYSL